MAMMSRLKLVDQERKEVLEHNRRFGVYNAENKKEVPPKYPIEAMLEIATDAGCNTNQQNNARTVLFMAVDAGVENGVKVRKSVGEGVESPTV
jgi:hypothetical protein